MIGQIRECLGATQTSGQEISNQDVSNAERHLTQLLFYSDQYVGNASGRTTGEPLVCKAILWGGVVGLSFSAVVLVIAEVWRRNCG